MRQVPIKVIIKKAGGFSAIANTIGVSRQAVFQWRRVPKRHLARVAKLAGLTMAQVRNDLA